MPIFNTNESLERFRVNGPYKFSGETNELNAMRSYVASGFMIRPRYIIHLFNLKAGNKSQPLLVRTGVFAPNYLRHCEFLSLACHSSLSFFFVYFVNSLKDKNLLFGLASPCLGHCLVAGQKGATNHRRIADKRTQWECDYGSIRPRKIHNTICNMRVICYNFCTSFCQRRYFCFPKTQ